MASSIPQQGVGNLQTLIKRLEAATSRLEDIALAQSSAALMKPTSEVGAGIVPSSSVVTVTSPVAFDPAPVPVPVPVVDEDAPAVVGYDEMVGESVKEFGRLSKEIGGLVEEQADLVLALFGAQRDLLKAASKAQKPKEPAAAPLMKLLEPFQENIGKITELRDRNRPSKLFNHLSTVSEGIPALGWVQVEPKPGPFVAEMKDAAQFYANRVIKEYKDIDKKHVEWTRSYAKLLDDLRQYIMKFHTTGLMWNPRGDDLESYLSKASSSAPAAPAPPASGPPPPPPPPPVMTDFSTPAAPAPGGGDMASVFAQLNQGETISKGLRKVDPGQMTHKNPELRGKAAHSQQSSSSSSKKPPARPAKPASFRVKKPPKKQLEGSKWAVEHFEDDRAVIIEDTELNHSVNIFGCKNSVIQVKGKVNAISIASCTKTAVLLESVVSSLEITNSPSFTVQILGKVPTILIDSTDSGQIFLSKDSLDAEIVTAKCSAINVSLPVEGGEEGEFEERNIPEQLKTVVKDGKLVTTIVEHSG